jgi:hypothetical protein
MKETCSRLFTLISGMLEPEEREVVRGDFAESEEPAARALIGVIGLVLRRQLGLWKRGGPWIALTGIVCVLGIPLSRIFLRFDRVFYERAWEVLRGHPVNPFNFPGRTGPGLDLAFMVCLSLAFLLWSWTSGFVMASFARRATWLTAMLFYFVVLDFAWLEAFLSRPDSRFRLTTLAAADFLIDAAMAFFIALPLYWGVTHALQSGALKRRWIAGLGTATAILSFLLSWMGSWYEKYETPNGSVGRPDVQSLLILGWPITYLSVRAIWQVLRKSEPDNEILES